MVVQLHVYVDVGSTPGCSTETFSDFLVPQPDNQAYVIKQYNLVLAKMGGKQGLH